uniref:Uncharacterized protein n=1 Tax=Eutreptiella gymnastica TaxID=73025 RepID=A0A7S1N2T4_9EUGL|mmetsp:Transcript_11085/g.19856  ORF Transcript_11085/g.19856 Transcript_11085/m.19856 type:complete len:811 (+) Transcript_11085:258-2690(+)
METQVHKEVGSTTNEDSQHEALETHPGMDILFRQLFRIDSTNTECDKLALLACNRQGIRADELMHMAPEDFYEKGINSEQLNMRFVTSEKRRQAKIKLVEAERQALLESLLNKSTKFSPGNRQALISRAEQGRALQLLEGIGIYQDSADGMATSPAGTEGAASRCASASSRQAKETSKNKYQEDYEKLRARELRAVEKELYLEVVSEQLHQTIQEKDAKSKAVAAQRAAALAERAKMAKEIAMAKVEKLNETNERLAEEKRQRFEEAQLRRRQQEARKAEEAEQKAHQRSMRMLNKMYNAAERNRLVQESLESRCEMQREGISHKLQVFEERRKNIQLHRDTKKEIGKIRALQKTINVHEAAERRVEDEAQWKHQIVLKEHAATERVQQQRGHMKAMLQERRLLVEAREQRRQELRSIQEVKYQEGMNHVLMKHHAKQEHIEVKKQKEIQQQQLRAEQKVLKLQNWIDNRKRLNRMEEYKVMVKEAKIAADNRRCEEFQRQRQIAISERQELRRAAQGEKEKLLREIEELRASPDPQVFLNKSSLGASLGVSGRAASATPGHGGPRSPPPMLPRPSSLPDLDLASDDSYPSPSAKALSSPADSKRLKGSLLNTNGTIEPKLGPSAQVAARRDLRSDISRRLGDSGVHAPDLQESLGESFHSGRGPWDMSIGGTSVSPKSPSSPDSRERPTSGRDTQVGSTSGGQAQGGAPLGSVAGHGRRRPQSSTGYVQQPQFMPMSPAGTLGAAGHLDDRLSSSSSRRGDRSAYSVYLQPIDRNARKGKNMKIATELMRPSSARPPPSLTQTGGSRSP